MFGKNNKIDDLLIEIGDLTNDLKNFEESHETQNIEIKNN